MAYQENLQATCVGAIQRTHELISKGHGSRLPAQLREAQHTHEQYNDVMALRELM